MAIAEFSNMKKIRLGISPCPNDTFAFYHLLTRRDDLPFEIEILIADVEELNRRVIKNDLDISKVSFHLFGHVYDRYRLLRSGSALGRGCGPLLLTQGHGSLEYVASGATALPGRYTTAAMLFTLFMEDSGFPDANTVHMNFSEITDAIVSRRVNSGVVIHETRFTYRERGLHCLRDLGQWWEDATGKPVPLGGIIASRRLDSSMVHAFDSALRESIEYAYNNPEEALEFCAGYAQEMAPDVMKRHIDLYVNSYTLDIGHEGEAAVRFMLQYGAKCGMFPESMVQNRIFPHE